MNFLLFWVFVVFPIATSSLVHAAEGDEWPPLPKESGDALIPAQEWPRYPGTRQVRAYVVYPGGSLRNTTPQTGLFLDLHNWGGTFHRGTANPGILANRYNTVVICVDYLQSGQDWTDTPPYDFGYFQALDAIRALYWVYNGLETQDVPFDRGRIYSTGGSGGGNVTLMVNKLAPRTFACAIDMCGMAKLADDLAFGIPGRTSLNARYSPNPEHPCYLNADIQALRFVGHPEHAAKMKSLGNTCRLVVVHGVEDASCPVDDAREMVANFQAEGLEVEPHWIAKDDLDGVVFKSAGHPLGDRTKIVCEVADAYLLPDSPQVAIRAGQTDFDRADEAVRYETPGGTYVISYKKGWPVGRFERD